MKKIIIMKKKKEIDELKKINNTYNEEIKKLEEVLKENEKYFNNYEKNRVEHKKKLIN